MNFFFCAGMKIMQTAWVEFPLYVLAENAIAPWVGLLGYSYNLESGYSLVCPENKFMIL